jgi:rhodanese-related sulfurtransferase
MGGGAVGHEVVIDASSTGGSGGERPYIILDMRPEDHYERFHIRTATSFPVAYLSRSTNCFTRDVLPYINHPSHIVIIYCDDEKQGVLAAARLAEKNVENCYLVSP